MARMHKYIVDIDLFLQHYAKFEARQTFLAERLTVTRGSVKAT